MAVVLLPLALGILFSEYVVLPIWLWVAMLFTALFIALRYKEGGATSICVSIFALGGLLHSVHIPDTLPYGERVRLQLIFDNDSRLRDGYNSATARITKCNEQECQSGVVVYSDTTLLFKAGDRIEAMATVRPFKSEHRGYASLMYHRGYVGTTNISQWNIENLTPAKGITLHDRAAERLRALMPPSDARAVVMAMGIGSKSEIRPPLSEIYSHTGAAHLLAVSGLHVGIVFMLVNLLLAPLALFYTGNIFRSIIVVATIWIYVFLCGMSPSAIRAAIMFSLLQLSLNSTREYLSGN
ncbi:MAG: ComEC/Rec2 family competence protein, partial [Alistipes sp.]|nr:ComEC/Rec2 family competence protein [Alistipes sp.]